jgi:hypothetical protein
MAYHSDRYKKDSKYRERIKESVKKYQKTEKGQLARARAAQLLKERYPDYIKEYMRKRREIADKKGLCIRCLKNRQEKRYKTCAACRAKDKAKSDRFRENNPKYYPKIFKKKREEAKKAGICIRCFQRKAAKGKTHCGPCLDAMLAIKAKRLNSIN